MQTLLDNKITFNDFKESILSDYKLACLSREASILGRREVLTGKAKFGIFGAGKELPQLALSKIFKNGDFRSGYYRDITLMLALGLLTVEQSFSSLYAHTDVEKEPMTGGRQMNGHFGTRFLNEDGTWKNLNERKNSSIDVSSTANQMARLVGLGLATKIYRENPSIKNAHKFSNNGQEIVFGTIGDASTSEGIFWEAMNAIGILQLPIIMSIWDDDYGISVPGEYQTIKNSISEALKGFQRSENSNGWEILSVKGWDYPALLEVYQRAEELVRGNDIPVLIHVEELTQTQGHSTSGSHERYKSNERLEWEKENDCLLKMRQWILQYHIKSNENFVYQIATQEELDDIEKQAKNEVRIMQKASWNSYKEDIVCKKNEALTLIENILSQNINEDVKRKILATRDNLKSSNIIYKKTTISSVRAILRSLIGSQLEAVTKLKNWLEEYKTVEQHNYSSHLYSETDFAATKIKEVKPEYGEDNMVNGRIIIRDNFKKLFETHSNLLTFGEDTGKLGDVNQGLEGLQELFGKWRVADTGIREASIIGQGIGLAMRGLRPIAEIQYLDYIFYGLHILTDDLATLLYRSKGGQKAPLIIRTRGHRLEGIWHAGSHMGALMHSLRGVCILTPRNMTVAAGMYNTLLECDDPALVIENLNGYRLKENLPINIGKFRVPIGVVETIRKGRDITVVTYGSMCKIVLEASKELSLYDIEVEVIDAQSLLPFDINCDAVKSLQKTNLLLIADEDVPGGASASILQDILERQNGFKFLDHKPKTLSAREHRCAYSTDGDYFSKPSSDDVFESIYEMMHEYNPGKYPKI